MQPRYFIGILLPDELRHAIGKVQHELFAPHKVMEPLKPHITLLHPNLLETLSPIFFLPKVREVAEHHLPLTIKLTRIALFDKRVLHIAVDCPELDNLHHDLTDLLPESVRASYMQQRPFTPHVTLAQAKPKQKLTDELITEFQTRLESLLAQSFTATHLTEFRWLRPRTYRTTEI